MFCHKCGKEVPANVSFCRHCGVKLHTPVQPVSPLQTTYAGPSGAPHKKKRPTKRIIMSVVFTFFSLFLLLGSYQLFALGSVQNKADRVVYLEVFDKRKNLLGTGSGFFIEDGKTLVTNYHVIEGAYEVTVSTADSSGSTKATKVLAYDKRADLAILQCNSDLGVKPLHLADSDTAKQGDKVFAVGYPLGLANTMSDGIISSRYYDEYNVDVIQITAAISPGSSGGALLNSRGSVIGVTSAYYIDGQNLNIAIASNTVRKLYENRSNTSHTLGELKGLNK